MLHYFQHGNYKALQGLWVDVDLTKDAPYLALAAELWSIYCEHRAESDREILRAHGTIHIVPPS